MYGPNKTSCHSDSKIYRWQVIVALIFFYKALQRFPQFTDANVGDCFREEESEDHGLSSSLEFTLLVTLLSKLGNGF
jgi:hypothetical protein